MPTVAIFFEEGYQHYMNKRYREAVKSYSEALRLDPRHAKSYFERGYSYALLGENENAIADYTEVIRLKPGSDDAYFERGNCYRRLNQTQEAIRDFGEAIRLNPRHILAYYNRGSVHYNVGKYEEAVADLSETLRLDPKYADAYYNRGIAYSKRGQYEKALQDFDMAFQIDPQQADTHNSRGLALQHLQQYGDALEAFGKAIRLDPNFTDARFNRGLLHGMLGLYEKAVEDFDAVLRLNQQDDMAYFNRGFGFEKLGRKAEAAADYYRFLYLASEDIRNHAQRRHNTLFSFFANRVPAPYLLKNLVKHGCSWNPQSVALVESVLDQAKVLDERQTAQQLGLPVADFTVSQLSAYVREQTTRDTGKLTQYCQWLTLVNYHFGDPVTAYRICDEILEEDNLLDGMTLAMQYIFARAAKDTQNPEERSVLNAALRQAKRWMENWQSDQSAQVETYYAGQLYFLNGDHASARACFDKIPDFLPARYMQVLVAEKTHDTYSRDKHIQAVADLEQHSYTYLTGLKPAAPTSDVAETLAHLYHHAHWVEVSPALTIVRKALFSDSELVKAMEEQFVPDLYFVFASRRLSSDLNGIAS